MHWFWVAIGWCFMTINVTMMCMMWVAVSRGVMVSHWLWVGVSRRSRMMRMMGIVWCWMTIC